MYQDKFLLKMVLLLIKGKVGKDININEAINASEICLLNTLAVLNLATNNNLNRIISCIKINVFINSSDDFFEQPLVADGASNLIKKFLKIMEIMLGQQ